MAKGLWPVLNVDNVDKSAEFYNAIGVKAKVEEMPPMGGLPATKMGSITLGDSGLLLWNKHSVPSDQPADTRAWVTGELGKGVLFTIGVANAQKSWAKAQEIRAEVDTPLEEQPWGGHGFSVIDPDGYVVNITDKFPDMGASTKPTKRRAVTKAKATKTKAKGGKKKGK